MGTPFSSTHCPGTEILTLPSSSLTGWFVTDSVVDQLASSVCWEELDASTERFGVQASGSVWTAAGLGKGGTVEWPRPLPRCFLGPLVSTTSSDRRLLPVNVSTMSKRAE